MLKTVSRTLVGLSQQLVAEIMSQTKEEEGGLQIHYRYCRETIILSKKIKFYIEVKILSLILMIQNNNSFQYEILIFFNYHENTSVFDNYSRSINTT